MSEQQPPSYYYPEPEPKPEPAPTAAFTDPAPQPAPVPTHRQPQKKRNVGVIVGIALVLAGLAGLSYYALFRPGINETATPAAAAASEKPDTPIQAAVDKCFVHDRVQDDGHSITLDRVEAKKNPGPSSLQDMQCMLQELKVPSYIVDHIGTTRAMDGMQTDSWEGMNARWNYHPDNGMNITFYDAK